VPFLVTVTIYMYDVYIMCMFVYMCVCSRARACVSGTVSLCVHICVTVCACVDCLYDSFACTTSIWKELGFVVQCGHFHWQQEKRSLFSKNSECLVTEVVHFHCDIRCTICACVRERALQPATSDHIIFVTFSVQLDHWRFR